MLGPVQENGALTFHYGIQMHGLVEQARAIRIEHGKGCFRLHFSKGCLFGGVSSTGHSQVRFEARFMPSTKIVPFKPSNVATT